MSNNLLQMHLKLLQKELLKKKKTEATGHLVGNKIADKITSISTTSPQNNSVTNEEENLELDEEIHRERYISSKQRQKVINDLRL